MRWVLSLFYVGGIDGESKAKMRVTDLELRGRSGLEVRIRESSSQGECGVWLMILEGGPVHATVMGIMEGESGWQC